MKITDNIFLVPNVVANPYVIVDADGLTLIDAGLPGSQKKILSYVADLGKAARDITRIILTHSDLDHVGGLTALHKATAARTYASPIEAQAIATGKSSRVITPARPMPIIRRLFLLLFRPRPFKVDELLTDGQVLPVAGGLRVIDTAGHCPGHISLFAPSSGVLFCGDSMVSDQNGLHASRPELTWDRARAAEAVGRQAALGAHIVCPGHGPVITDASGKFPV